MQPSSLVLVAIVGMWAAYLVPSWIRRGESRLARRQADRVAEDARVLEPRPVAEVEPEGPSTAPLLKRSAGPVVTASVPAESPTLGGRSLAELMHDPHRAIGDDVEVRRVEAGVIEPEAGARILRRARAELPPDAGSPEVAPARRPAVRGAAEPGRESVSASRPEGFATARAVDEPPERPARRPELPAHRPESPARRPERPAARRPDRPSSAAAVGGSRASAAARAAQRRARLLLVLVLATGASWAVVGLAHVSVLAAVPASLLLGLDVLLLLATAPARARRRRAVVPERRLAAAPVRRQRAEAPTAAQGRRRTATVYDVDGAAVPDAGDDDHVPERITQPDDGTWIPVPVPPPTYTMKPVVHRHEPLIIEPIETLPAAEAGVSLGGPLGSSAGAAAAADVDDDVDAGDVTFDLEAVLARRRAVNG